MTRFPDWQNRLAAYVEAIRAVPFSYGYHDCALFAAGAVEAMTGEDLSKKWRGYRSLDDGIAKLRKAGIRGQVDLAASLLPEVLPIAAMPGDVVSFDIPGGEALGILQGRMFYAVTMTGLGLHSRSAVKRAFTV